VSTSLGSTLACSSASRQALAAIPAPLSPGSIQWRSSMPVRSTIHSLVVSIHWVMSWLVTTRGGRYPPSPRIRLRRSCMAPLPSDIEIPHHECVVLDEVATRLDQVAHEDGEYLIRLDAVIDADLEQRAPRRVHGGLPQLL